MNTNDQFAAYRNTAPTRPAWATALIVAAAAFIAGIAMWFMSGLGVAAWFFLAVLVTLIVAGILALTKAR